MKTELIKWEGEYAHLCVENLLQEFEVNPVVNCIMANGAPVDFILQRDGTFAIQGRSGRATREQMEKILTKHVEKYGDTGIILMPIKALEMSIFDKAFTRFEGKTTAN